MQQTVSLLCSKMGQEVVSGLQKYGAPLKAQYIDSFVGSAGWDVNTLKGNLGCHTLS